MPAAHLIMFVHSRRCGWVSYTYNTEWACVRAMGVGLWQTGVDERKTPTGSRHHTSSHPWADWPEVAWGRWWSGARLATRRLLLETTSSAPLQPPLLLSFFSLLPPPPLSSTAPPVSSTPLPHVAAVPLPLPFFSSPSLLFPSASASTSPSAASTRARQGW